MLAGLFDAARDAVAVQRPQGFERLENHQRERPLPDIGFLAHRFSPDVGSRYRPSYGEGIGIMAQLVWPGNSKCAFLPVWREEMSGMSEWLFAAGRGEGDLFTTYRARASVGFSSYSPVPAFTRGSPRLRSL